MRELNSFDNLYFEIENEPYITLENDIPEEPKSNLAEITKSSGDWQHKVVTWIKGEEGQLPNKHLISQNIANGERQISQPDPGVSIFNFHYAASNTVTENYCLNKAIGFNETGFAGKTDITYRRQAWRFLMAGGGLFNNLDYSFSPGGEDGQDTSYTAPGGGSPALRRQFGILKRFFDGLNIVKLKPGQPVLTAPADQITESLSDGKTVSLIFFEKHTVAPYNIKLHLLTRGRKFYMMSVSTGKISRCYVIGKKFTTPAGMDDGVLIVKAAASLRLR